MAIRLRLAAGTAICAAVALAGCSTGVQAGDEDHARAAVSTLLSLCAEGRGVDALALLSTPARRAFLEGEDARAGCERVIGLVPGEGDDVALDTVFEQARVTRVRAHGGLAEIEVGAPGGLRATLEAEDVGDEWLITNTRLPA